MVAAKKKIKDYFAQSMRKLKHRKGFGVHSPFAYSIITEVIEEKLPYYAYHRMQRTYDKQAAIPFKVACLLLRLANRFGCRRVAELGCDGGYSLLPLVLTDTRLHATTVASAEMEQQVRTRLAWLPQRLEQISYVRSLDDIEGQDLCYDMILVGSNSLDNDAGANAPVEQQQAAAARLVEWVMAHSTDNTLIWVHGIQAHHRMEHFWDQLCDLDDVSITMDLYDYGLAILKPRFFKQHYIVSF